MALTEERLRERQAPGAPTASEVEALVRGPAEPGPAGATAPAWRRSLLSERGLLVAWLLGFGALLVFEPVPDDASVALWESVLAAAFTAALFTTFAGLAAGAPWGRRASALTAGAGIGVAVACVATGHHAGMWWLGEAAVFGGLLALTRAARTSPH